MSEIANVAESLRKEFSPREGHDLFEFAALRDAVLRNLPLLCIWLATCWMVAAFILVRTPVQYTASTQVALESIPKKRSSSTRETALNSLDAAQAETRVEAVKGERLLRFVFDSLKVKDFPEFRPQPAGLLQRILQPVRGAAEGDSAKEQTAAFMSFMDRVNARRLGLSYVIEISYVAPTPHGAAAMANSITSAYIRDRVIASEKDEEILERRISDIKRQADLLTAGMMEGIVPEGEFSDADARVISAAITPLTKSSPKTTLTFAFATVFALLTGFGATMVGQRSDRRLRTARQVHAATALVCVATLPMLPGAAEKRPSSPFTSPWPTDGRAALRHLFARMRNAPRSEQAIGMLACRAGAGTSSICYELARGLASEGRRVVLVDANLRSPALSETLNPDGRHNLVDLLGRQDLGGSVTELTSGAGIRLLSARRGEHQAEHIAASPKLRFLMEQMAKHAPVIVDLPALDTSDVMLQAAAALSGVYLVVVAGETTDDDLRDALVLLRESRVTPLGVILTKVRSNAWHRIFAGRSGLVARRRRSAERKAAEGQILATE